MLHIYVPFIAFVIFVYDLLINTVWIQCSHTETIFTSSYRYYTWPIIDIFVLLNTTNIYAVLLVVYYVIFLIQDIFTLLNPYTSMFSIFIIRFNKFKDNIHLQLMLRILIVVWHFRHGSRCYVNVDALNMCKLVKCSL